MKIEAVDFTTSLNLADPKHVYRLASVVNLMDKDFSPVHVELYAFARSFLPIIRKPIQAVSLEDVHDWHEIFGPLTGRIHFPWMGTKREIAFQAIPGLADWYKGETFKDLAIDYIKNQAVEFAMGAANNGHAIKMAHELGVGVNIHPNVTATLGKEGMAWLESQVPFILYENSVDFRSVHQPRRDVLGDPVATIQHEVKEYGENGFLLAFDHLYGLDKVDSSEEIFYRTVQAAKVLEEPLVQEHTQAMHLALPGHEFISLDDPNLEYLLRLMAQAPFKHPVRVALDFRSRKFDKMSDSHQVNYLCEFREKVFNTVERYN